MKTDIDTQMNEDVVEKIDVKRMSLSKRFIGSLIDKILIVAIFTVGYVIAKPYGGPGLLGKYIVMQKISPRKYTMIDLAELQNKGKHSTNIRVPDAYRRLAEMEKPRYIGATNDLDIQLSTIFIIVNIIFFTHSFFLLFIYFFLIYKFLYFFVVFFYYFSNFAFFIICKKFFNIIHLCFIEVC